MYEMQISQIPGSGRGTLRALAGCDAALSRSHPTLPQGGFGGAWPRGDRRSCSCNCCLEGRNWNLGDVWRVSTTGMLLLMPPGRLRAFTEYLTCRTQRRQLKRDASQGPPERVVCKPPWWRSGARRGVHAHSLRGRVVPCSLRECRGPGLMTFPRRPCRLMDLTVRVRLPLESSAALQRPFIASNGSMLSAFPSRALDRAARDREPRTHTTAVQVLAARNLLNSAAVNVNL